MMQHGVRDLPTVFSSVNRSAMITKGMAVSALVCFLTIAHMGYLQAQHGGMMQHGVDTSDPVKVLVATMKDLQSGSTKVAYQLASPTERMRIAGSDGHNHDHFKYVMMHEINKPLMSGNGYKVDKHGPYPPYSESKTHYYADLFVHTSPEMKNPDKFRFIMSLIPSNVVDQHDSLGPYKMHPGHQPVWRTDSIVLLQMKKCGPDGIDGPPMVPAA